MCIQLTIFNRIISSWRLLFILIAGSIIISGLNCRDYPKSQPARKEIAAISLTEQERKILEAIATDLEERIKIPEIEIDAKLRDEVLSTVFAGEETWNRSATNPPNTEILLWDKYELLIPIEDIIASSLRSDLLIFRFFGDWGIIIELDGLGHSSKSFLSEPAHEIFEKMVDEYHLSDKAKENLRDKLQGKFLFDSDLDLLYHIWSKDWTEVDLEQLTLTELIGHYYLLNIKLINARVGDSGFVSPVHKIKTNYLRGLSFDRAKKALFFELYDDEHNISITCHPDSYRRVGQIDPKIIQMCVSSLRPHQSQTPAKDMLQTAQKYLQITPEPLPQVAMVFVKAARQYKTEIEIEQKFDECERQVLDKLISNLKHRDAHMRIAAARWLDLLNIDEIRVIEPLIGATEDKDPRVREWVVRALGMWESRHKKGIIPILIKILEVDDALVRAAAARSLGNLCNQEPYDFELGKLFDVVVEKLIATAKDENPIVRENSIGGLRSIETPAEKVLPIFLEALNDEDEKVRSEAELALSRWTTLTPDAEPDCKTNLEMLVVSIILYQKDNNGECPADLGVLFDKGYLWGRSLLFCPDSSDFWGESSYIYRAADLNAQKVKEPSEMIVVYDKPGNHPDQSRNVAFVDGSVKEMTEQEFQDAVKKDNQHRREMGLPEKPADK